MTVFVPCFSSNILWVIFWALVHWLDVAYVVWLGLFCEMRVCVWREVQVWEEWLAGWLVSVCVCA